MTPERWQQVKAILGKAIECDDALGREAFLKSSCAGDQFLKQEVDALLAHADDGVVDELLIRVPVTLKAK